MTVGNNTCTVIDELQYTMYSTHYTDFKTLMNNTTYETSKNDDSLKNVNKAVLVTKFGALLSSEGPSPIARGLTCSHTLLDGEGV